MKSSKYYTKCLVYAYIIAFKVIALSIPDISDPELLNRFIWGLPNLLRWEVRFRYPATIVDAVRIALEFYKQLF